MFLLRDAVKSRSKNTVCGDAVHRTGGRDAAPRRVGGGEGACLFARTATQQLAFAWMQRLSFLEWREVMIIRSPSPGKRSGTAVRLGNWASMTGACTRRFRV